MGAYNTERDNDTQQPVQLLSITAHFACLCKLIFQMQVNLLQDIHPQTIIQSTFSNHIPKTNSQQHYIIQSLYITYNMDQKKPKSSSLEKETKPRLDHTKNQQESKFKPTKEGQKKQKITLGVCAMKKKVESKPMKEILCRIKCPEIEIKEMWSCLEEHWSTWPVVDALICFFSEGFPYLMAWRYVEKHKPYLINDLDKQQLLWDRTVIYDILKKIKVPVAKHYYVFRDQKYIDEIEQKGFGKLAAIPQPRKNIEASQDHNEYENKQTKQAQLGELKSNYRPMSNKQIGRQSADKLNSNELFGELRDSSKFEEGKRRSKTMQILDNEKFPTLLKDFYEQRTNCYCELQQTEEDTITLKMGDEKIKLKKPFVEKPFNSQNHEICVYYPSDMGGGRKKLFRKMKNSSSEYEREENYIRKDDNYIYEEFLPTNAFDIKVYTIGPYYMYAQARKSPTLDGVVQRNKEGKELRYHVILTPDQKFICNRIVEQFGQQVCGFDLLRANGKSYVCDVNGWSFVKSNPKYWDDCAKILRKKIFGQFFPEKVTTLCYTDKFPINFQNEYRPPLNNLNPRVEELRSIVSIFRHADRSPKMKLKIKTSEPRFIALFKDQNKDELKLKDAFNLTKVLEMTIEIIAQMDPKDSAIKDFLQMKLVLEAGGHFDGLTRKLQLKVLDRDSSDNGKGQIKKIMLVLKWGGDLSFLGYEDAIELGRKMRTERYDDKDCLSLYSSYRHDLKTYASDEGRCIKTAAAFLKGFLSIQGELAPIISTMVQADAKAQRLLDCTSQQNHSELADKLCQRLSEIMNSDEQLLKSYLNFAKEGQIPEAMVNTMKVIGRPRQKMTKLHEIIKVLVAEIERIYLEEWQEQNEENNASPSNIEEKCENIMLVSSRWSKLKKDFYDSETNKYNISKIPEIYDTIRYDYRKNGLIFKQIDVEVKENLYWLAKLLAYFVVFNEYGITDDERIKVGTEICLPLLDKILVDLMFWKENTSDEYYWKYKNSMEADNWRHIRTRLYFTSASHMYSMLNILTLGNDRAFLKKTPAENAKRISNIIYMGYLSHIELRLYENLTLQLQNPNRFRLQITFSTKFKKSKEMKQEILGGKGFTINEIQQFIESFVRNKPPTKEDRKQNE